MKTETKAQAKHTPGPWHRNVGPKYPIYDDKHTKVAYCLYGKFDQPSEDEAMANLRLIAAAPDLLAAANHALDAMFNNVRGEKEFNFAMDELHAAIRKAMGEGDGDGR